MCSDSDDFGHALTLSNLPCATQLKLGLVELQTLMNGYVAAHWYM
jgi:hypothetical protein